MLFYGVRQNAEEAADALKLDAEKLVEFGIIDCVVNSQSVERIEIMGKHIKQ